MAASGLRLKSRPRGRTITFIGALFILAGGLLLLFGWPKVFDRSALRFERVAELTPGDTGFPDLMGHFKADRLITYQLHQGDSPSLPLQMAEYRDDHGKMATAIMYPTVGGAKSALSSQPNALRAKLWGEAAQAIQQHSDAKGLFLTWWDNAQRIRFLTGHDSWADLPAADAYSDSAQKNLWEQAGGGFEPEGRKLKQLARWLTMDADQALVEIAAVVPTQRPIYFLICLDDLARLTEIETLSGKRLPFELNVFPASDNLHAQIASVRRWANQKPPGSYLVQKLSSGDVRAWRISSEEGAKSLLARLLPFTTSIGKPMEKMSLVYQSEWGGYLSIYQWWP